MIDPKQVSEWRQHHRQSVRALPVALGVFAALCVGFFVVNLFVSVPTWLAAILLGVGAFSVIGDAINVVHLGRKLRNVEEDEAASAPARGLE